MCNVTIHKTWFISAEDLLYLISWFVSSNQLFFFVKGTIATAVDPSAITAIHSATTFSTEQPIKYVFKTEANAGQVKY